MVWQTRMSVDTCLKTIIQAKGGHFQISMDKSFCANLSGTTCIWVNMSHFYTNSDFIRLVRVWCYNEFWCKRQGCPWRYTFKYIVFFLVFSVYCLSVSEDGKVPCGDFAIQVLHYLLGVDVLHHFLTNAIQNSWIFLFKS